MERMLRVHKKQLEKYWTQKMWEIVDWIEDMLGGPLEEYRKEEERYFNEVILGNKNDEKKPKKSTLLEREEKIRKAIGEKKDKISNRLTVLDCIYYMQYLDTHSE